MLDGIFMAKSTKLILTYEWNKKTIDAEEFISVSKGSHKFLYDYSKSVYINSRTPVVITCPEHGDFEQLPLEHMKGRDCPLCSNGKSSAQNFIYKADCVHGKKYDYSLTEYVNSITKVKIICKKHGAFEQQPRHHLNGSGCKKCVKKKKSETSSASFACLDLDKLSIESAAFVRKARAVHGDVYDYSLIAFVDSRTPVIIVCSKHGNFEQKPFYHLLGTGCKWCKSEKRKATR